VRTPKWFYEVLYSRFRAPYDVGPRKELVELVESGRFKPCRAIDLGSGTASNCVFLAQHGFDVTGVDFAYAAIELGKRRAEEAGVTVDFVQDDLTNLRHINGKNDLLVDFGTLDDLNHKDRELYLKNILPLTHPGSLFLIYCFEWEPRWFEQLFPLKMAFDPDETQRHFGDHFHIERYAAGTYDSRLMPGWAVYLMTRNGGG
jgi:ubiquinone/menaquinone biosynthesis C-methylase UbiE